MYPRVPRTSTKYGGTVSMTNKYTIPLCTPPHHFLPPPSSVSSIFPISFRPVRPSHSIYISFLHSLHRVRTSPQPLPYGSPLSQRPGTTVIMLNGRNMAVKQLVPGCNKIVKRPGQYIRQGFGRQMKTSARRLVTLTPHHPTDPSSGLPPPPSNPSSGRPTQPSEVQPSADTISSSSETKVSCSCQSSSNTFFLSIDLLHQIGA